MERDYNLGVVAPFLAFLDKKHEAVRPILHQSLLSQHPSPRAEWLRLRARVLLTRQFPVDDWNR